MEKTGEREMKETKEMWGVEKKESEKVRWKRDGWMKEKIRKQELERWIIREEKRDEGKNIVFEWLEMGGLLSLEWLTDW